jgi:hypothetical protein
MFIAAMLRPESIATAIADNIAGFRPAARASR